MIIKAPQPGDLISIHQEISGVVINDRRKGTSNWGYVICKITSGHTALILETYIPSALAANKPPGKSDALLQSEQEKVARKLSPDKRPPYKKVPEGIMILVLSIGENIVEIIWDPDYMDTVSI